MSEFQYVGFRAASSPVSEKNLAFMRQQSSRADVTPWSFDNEYHYGDFHGDAAEMMRRGYDMHLHYANFGVRTLMIRLPKGLPDPAAAMPYFGKDSLRFLKDPKGKGGIVAVEPYHEPGDLEELWSLGELLDRLVPLHAEILDGDLRPLYLAHLAMASDGNHDPENSREGPVPAGLASLSAAQKALLELYGLNRHLIAAAARNSPAMAAPSAEENEQQKWIKSHLEAVKNAWLVRCLTGDPATVKHEIRMAFQKDRPGPCWPTFALNRTVAELTLAATEIRDKTDRRSAQEAARERAKKLRDMAADPTRTIQETDKLAARRSVDSYQQIANLLADLREALAGSAQAGLAEQQARALRKKNPTLHRLTSELKSKGLLER
jgi:hypothetical protein